MRLVPKRVKTCDEFMAALQRMPFARDRVSELERVHATAEGSNRSYGLWHCLLRLVHDAIAQRDWPSVGELLKLYDAVHLAGEHSEMWEASYVAFLEDVSLPAEPSDLRSFWQVCPPIFLRNIQRERGIQRAR